MAAPIAAAGAAAAGSGGGAAAGGAGGSAAGGSAAGGAGGGKGAGLQQGLNHAPRGGGGNSDEEEDSGGGHLLWLAGGLVAGVCSLLLLILIPVIVITGIQRCDTSTAEAATLGTPDIGLSDLQIATKIYDVGKTRKMTERRILSAYITVLVESGGGVTMRNPLCENAGDCDRDSVGAFQQRNLPEWTKNGRNRANVTDAAHSYFDAVPTYDAPGISAGELATRVQRMAADHKHRYLTDAVAARAREYLSKVKSEGGNARLATVRLASIASNVVLAQAAPGGSDDSGETELAWPISPKVTPSSPFGPRSAPTAGASSNHEGVDLPAPSGKPIHAAAAGTIVFRGWNGGYGNYICIRHKAFFSTCYAHMSRYGRYQMGQLVNQGDVIGFVGNTGVGTGAHLHFEVRLSGSSADPAKDPMPYLNGAGMPESSSGALASAANCGEEGAPAADEEAPVASGPTPVLNGKVLSAPVNAPTEIKKMIAAGNALRNFPYFYGGGHNAGYKPTGQPPGYDCSSTVSYVLWKAGLMKGPPLTSGGLAKWGAPGPGKWVSIYSNAGHTFIVIAGQRLDTSRMGSNATEKGPRWRGTAPRGDEGRFTVTHPPGF